MNDQKVSEFLDKIESLCDSIHSSNLVISKIKKEISEFRNQEQNHMELPQSISLRNFLISQTKY